MTNTPEALPCDLSAAHRLILAERAARRESEARAARVEADAHASATSAEALIARLRLEIEKLRRTLYGVRSERKERLVDQLEMQLEDAEADATEDELAAERAAPSTVVKSFERKRPARKPFPEHLPRERVVIAAPHELPLLRLDETVEARRGRHRDARGRPAPVEGDPDGSRAVLLPAVRGDQPAAGAVPCHAARLRRPEPAGDDPVREVRPASAAEPAERALRLRGDRSEPVDARRPGGRLRRGAASAATR